MLIFPLNSSDMYDVVLISDRSMNQEIILSISLSDYDTSLLIMNALGQREDGYVADIIIYLYSVYRGREQYKIEFLLQTLLKSLFNPEFSEQELRERFLLNQEALDLLIRHLSDLQSPLLKAEIIKTVGLSENTKYYSLLAAEGELLVALLQKNNGWLDPDSVQELIALLNIIAASGENNFSELCNSIIKFSHNRDVVKLARQVVKGLLE